MTQEDLNKEERRMLSEIWAELRHMRKRLDKHIDDEKQSFLCVERQLGQIRADMAKHVEGQATKMRGMVTGVALVVSTFMAALMTWLFRKFGG